jgi:hypothetical protein
MNATHQQFVEYSLTSPGPLDRCLQLIFELSLCRVCSLEAQTRNMLGSILLDGSHPPLPCNDAKQFTEITAKHQQDSSELISSQRAQLHQVE